MNWTDLTTYERKALIELLTGHRKVRSRVPEDQSLLDKGLLLEDLDLGVHLSELGFNLAAEYIVIPATPAPTELERLQAERKQLRDALKTVLRKANSLAGYYPEPGDERESYGMDAPIIFDDIRKVAREALEIKND